MAEHGQPELNQERVTALQQAMTAGPEELFQLILSPDAELLPVLVKNPQLTEDHLLALLKRRDLAESLLRNIYQRHSSRLSHRLIVALAKNPNLPGAILRPLLVHLRLFELVDLCFLPGITPDQKLAAEQTILQRLPTTPLGSKMTLARRATANVVGELVKEGDPQLVEICLNSPHLREAAVFQFINGPRTEAATLSMVARNGRWKNRPNLQMALLKNRKTPAVWFTLWLPKLATQAINQLLTSRRLTVVQKNAIREELTRRGKQR